MRKRLWTMALWALGCGEGAEGEDPDAQVTADAAPANDAAFAPGARWAGEGAKLQVELVSATPIPPQRDLNEWVVAVSDAAGAPQAGCDLGVGLYMPAHGHAAPTEPTVEGGATAGHYVVSGIDFFMPGAWEVTFVLACGAVTDRATVTVEIAR